MASGGKSSPQLRRGTFTFLTILFESFFLFLQNFNHWVVFFVLVNEYFLLIIGKNAALCNSDVERRPTSSGTTPSPSVIVIGGGMAGISAARALHDASFQVPEMKFVNAKHIQVCNTVDWLCRILNCPDQVVLLESRDRVGGRVHTDYSFGFPIDLGASW